MGHIDAVGEYSDGQALTTTAVSTDVVDHAIVAANTGAGSPVFIENFVSVALTGGTSVQAAWQTSAVEGSGYGDIIDGQVIATAALLAGVRLIEGAILPVEHLQFSRLNYTIVGTYAAGTVEAYLALQHLDNT